MHKAPGCRFHNWILSVTAAAVIAALSLSQGIDTAHAQSGVVIHVVAWGETLSSIAAHYGVTSNDIAARNNIANGDRIYVGQQLIIPMASGGNAPLNEGDKTHVVQAGETLFRISLKYNVSMHSLMSANGLTDEDKIYVGQNLVIPQSGGAAPGEASSSSSASLPNYHTVLPGETLSSISRKYNISLFALQTANGLVNPSLIYVGQRLMLPGAANAVDAGYTPEQATITHVVRAGENLSTIAAQYGVSMWVIAQANNIRNLSFIYQGQVLSIPKKGSLSPGEQSHVTGAKSIVVDVSEQRTYIYENGVALQVFVVSTGLPGQDTMRGSFNVQNKIPVAYAATWDLQMPHWVGFYWAGPLQNGFHALPILSDGSRLWEGLLGRPASYGCVILSETDAQWLYEWVDIGTPVVVQN